MRIQKIGLERGEGSKPIFERDDVKVNAIGDCETQAEIDLTKSEDNIRNASTKSAEKFDVPKSRDSIEPHSSRKVYEHRGCCGKVPNSKSHTGRRQHQRAESTTSEKVPYYRDSIRERDRLKRLYGDSYNQRSRSRTPERKRRSEGNGDRHKNIFYSKYHNHYKEKYTPPRSRSQHRSPIPSRPATHSSQHGRESRSPHLSRRWHSAKRQRSTSPSSRPERERSSESEALKDREDRVAIAPPSPFIPVPVAIADYSFPFPPWTYPNSAWPNSVQHRPSGTPYGFPLVPLMPTMRPSVSLTYGAPPSSISFPPVPMGPYRPHFVRPAALRHNADHNQHHYKRQQDKR